MHRVTLVDILPHTCSATEQIQRMIELEKLVNTYGGLVIIKTLQKKDHPAYRTYIGQGKLDIILDEMIENQSDLLIIWNILKPSQVYAINEQMRLHPALKDNPFLMQCWDKVDLILKIFDKHAQSAEAKLQIELAAIKHMWPRIFGMGMEMSRQGGGASGGAGAARGIGETNTERMKRHLKEKIRTIEWQLKEYEQMRMLHRTRRKRVWLPTFGIVGYTNAGKSSLMRSLCKKDAYVADKLFATLGTEVGKLYLPPKSPVPEDLSYGDNSYFSHDDIPSMTEQRDNWEYWREVLIIDTIGFIRDLPPQLIKAFASTLEDSIQSDILLHVVDATDPDRQRKIEIVEDILRQIKANQTILMVFNKCDQLDEDTKQEITDSYHNIPHIFVSALTGQGLEELKQKMSEMLS